MATLMPRVLREGSYGRDVLALQRALQAAKIRPAALLPTKRYGVHTVAEVALFKHSQNIPPDGTIFGQRAFAALYPHYDAYGLMLLREVAKALAPPVLTTRQKIVQAAFLAYQKRDQSTYSEGSNRWSGIDGNVRPPNVPPFADCSSMVTWYYWLTLGSGPDMLNGLNWTGGFTGTMTAHGTEVSYAHARPGDLVFYGYNATISHVALYVGNGRVISDGNQNGPELMGIDYWVGGRQQIRSYLP